MTGTNRELENRVPFDEQSSSPEINDLKHINEELRQARRAALNLMEDALLSKEALFKSEEKYRMLFDAMDEGVAHIEMLYNEAGEPEDFRWIDVNYAFSQMTGFK